MEKQELEQALQICYNTNQLMDYFQENSNKIYYYLKKYNLKPLLNSHAKDERGNQYGSLTVIDFAGRNDRGEILWNCICSCGNNVIRSGVELRRPRSNPSCPDCLKQKLSKIKMINHTGERHGNLTVIRPVGKTNKNILWYCKCDCGNHLILESYKLNCNDREQLSCSCLQSKGEFYINEILTELKLNYKTQIKFKDCLNSKTNYPYKFDFGVFKDNNLLFLIEYNGQQHYQSSKSGFYTDDVVKDIQFRDKEKIQYCNQHKIPLLIIPYTKNNKELILKEIQSFMIGFN